MKRLNKLLIVISALLLLGIGLLVWGFVIEPNLLFATHYDLKLRNWSPPMNGLKIVAVSDLHAGSDFITENKIQQIVKTINAQDPDLVLCY